MAIKGSFDILKKTISYERTFINFVKFIAKNLLYCYTMLIYYNPSQLRNHMLHTIVQIYVIYCYRK